ncbi:MAG: transporter substrate-binding domain-containing protein [Gammaproteobacteria bacterium]|nr:transporter substrate-binding domain-containing protein [Gammaproteobacteria bacterium]
MIFLRYSLFVISLIFSAAFSQQLLADSNYGGTLLNKIQQQGVLNVGVSMQAPWVMKNNKGKLIGFEIDIANQLANDLGVRVKFKQYPWQNLIPALKQGKIDIIASGLSITAKRALEINFSNSYASSGYSLVSNLSLTSDFTSIKDLNNNKIYIAAVQGTVSADLASKIFPNAILDLRKTSADATSAVVNGSVHAFIASSPIPEFVSLKYANKVDSPLKKPLLTTKEAFAIKKNNQEMLNFLNAWITAHQADEWISSSHKYWFNNLDWRSRIAKQK